MSDRNDELHDEYLSALYRETREVEPPAWLDRRILMMAAVEPRPAPAAQRPKRRVARWAMPLALAATVVLTVGVVRMVRESGEPERWLMRSETARSLAPPAAEADAVATGRAEWSSSERKLPEAPPPAASPASAFSPEPSKPTPPAARQTPLGGALPASPLPTPSTAAPQSVPAKPSVPKPRSMAPIEREKNDGAAAPQSVPAKPSASKPGSMAPPERKKSEMLERAPAPVGEKQSEVVRDRFSQRSPLEWLAEIAELRRQGRTAEADASLAEFRRRYPDYPLDAVTSPR